MKLFQSFSGCIRVYCKFHDEKSDAEKGASRWLPLKALRFFQMKAGQKRTRKCRRVASLASALQATLEKRPIEETDTSDGTVCTVCSGELTDWGRPLNVVLEEAVYRKTFILTSLGNAETSTGQAPLGRTQNIRQQVTLVLIKIIMQRRKRKCKSVSKRRSEMKETFVTESHENTALQQSKKYANS